MSEPPGLKLEQIERERPPAETRSIRLDGDLNARLEELAKQENVNVNVVINKALLRYAEWEHRAEKFGLMTTYPPLMRRLFNRLTEEEARSLGKDVGAQFFAEFTNYWFKTLSLATILKTLELLCNRYGRKFRFEYGSDGQAQTLILKHDRGAKTSAYYSEALKSLFDRLNLKMETVQSDQQVTITILG